MTHMGMYPDDCEIVELEEEDVNLREHYIGYGHSKAEMKEEKDRRSPASPAGRISSLEDDLSQLFEIFNRKASAHGLAHQHQSGWGSPRKNTASKKPIKASGSYSPGYGISERVNLKQALRGLCISQASEMAALKRSGKSGASSAEAGKIMTMYRNAVVEDTGSMISQDEGKSSLLEISLVPEEITVESFHKIPERRLESDLRASNPKGQSDSAIGPMASKNRRVLESKPELLPKDPGSSPYRSSRDGGDSSMKTWQSAAPQNKKMLNSNGVVKHNLKPDLLLRDPASLPYWSSRDAGDSSVKAGQNTVMQNSVKYPPKEARNQTSLTDMPKRDRHTSLPASPAAKMPTVARNSLIDSDLFPTSPEPGFRTSLPELSLTEKDAPKSLSPHPNDGNRGLVLGKEVLPPMEAIQASVGFGNSTSKADLLHIEERPPVPSYRYDAYNNGQDVNKGSPSTNKVINRESTAKSAISKDKSTAAKAGQIGSSPTVPPSSPGKANKANKPTKNGSHFGKSVTKTRSFLKRKPKKDVATVESLKKAETEPNGNLLPGPHQIICPHCHHLLPDGSKDVKQDSLISPIADLSAEASSGTIVSSSYKSELTPDENSKAKAVIESSSNNSKSRDKGEFTQSSKSSPDECSSSTSISEDSNLSRPSCCDRPHMSKDIRWGAIRRVRMQQGTLGLRHFNLLKKLGCGDIGTVYLAELIGTNCLFAIKVMDNEFLSRRKKITRAQTEKEILRMLDHPFLPTLYCQFTSDNLSCLVMEYCPGGDLHVLRQRQPGRCFTEQAARFYVAEVLLALEYLHMLGVVYRDLKPENILVREDGHIMLSDFDLSLRCAVNPTLLVSSSSVIETTKRLSGPCVDSGCAEPFCIQPCRVSCFTPRRLPAVPSKSNSKSRNKMKSETADQLRPLLVAEPISARSNSFVGTHEYLAPEIIKGEGHGSAVDWWTFGIFLYELLYGKTPFKGVGNEETLANVVLQSLKFPESPLVSLQARDLIVSLLVKEPENRLGSERGAADIKQHPFFEGLNWALIRCAIPPELPEPDNIAFKKLVSSNENKDKYLDYNGEQLEFEVF